MATLLDLMKADVTSAEADKINIFEPVVYATAPQIKYLKDLIANRALNAQNRAYALAELPTLTKAAASLKITELKALPYAAKPVLDKPAVPIVNGTGMYQGGSGKIYSYRERSGWKNFYRLIITVSYRDNERKETGKFYYIKWPIAKQDIEDGGRKLTEEEARAFGHQHSFCMCCGRELNNKISVELGIGPVCRSKTLWA